jgi:predicted CxxxxCH...CXXCH cytochrome family protein
MTGAHKMHAGGIDLATYSFSNLNVNLSSGSGSFYGFGCGNCHPTDNALHANGSVNIELTNNAANASTLRQKNGAGAGYVSGKCDNVYCHSDGYNAPTAANTPTWTGNFSVADRCANCHGNSPTTPGAHSAHVVGIHYDDIFNGTSGKLAAGSTGSVSHGLQGQATTLNCNICHSSTVASSANDNNTVCKTCHYTGGPGAVKGPATISDLSFHVNGAVDVALSNDTIITKAQVRTGSFVNYTAVFARNNGNYKNGANAFDSAKTPLNPNMFTAGVKGQGSCANIACHIGYTVKWNDTLTCDSCHKRL